MLVLNLNKCIYLSLLLPLSIQNVSQLITNHCSNILQAFILFPHQTHCYAFWQYNTKHSYFMQIKDVYLWHNKLTTSMTKIRLAFCPCFQAVCGPVQNLCWSMWQNSGPIMISPAFPEYKKSLYWGLSLTVLSTTGLGQGQPTDVSFLQLLLWLIWAPLKMRKQAKI